jgi:hypothetical protein
MRRILRLGWPIIPVAVFAAFLQFAASPRGGVVTSAALPSLTAAPEQEISLRILLGLTDTVSTKWDGSLSVTAGKVTRVEPWRFDDDDSLEESSGATSTARWRISTHQARTFRSASAAAAQPNFTANGLVATFREITPGSEISVETPQGRFQFRPAEIAYGKPVKFLNGRAMVDRVPASNAVTRSRDDQDFPASAVDREGNAWIAYLQFKPNPKFTGIRWLAADDQPQKDMNELAEPTGGDQIVLARYSRGAWSDPIAVSDAGGDLYKPAIAVDGAGKVWVFWSANKDGNFDLYARSFSNGKAASTLKLTNDTGPDIVPAAAADVKGNVWVAWQAFRNGRSQIRAATQQGDKFSAEIIVGASTANEWNPAIAASPKGDVTIAWDSYRKGDYDVYFRTFDDNPKLGQETAAAASARYEAYPSIAYDSSGRLWVAWEESDAGWGKDFGADETTGIGLYHGRWIKLKVWQGERAFTPPDVGAVLPGSGRQRVDAPSRQSDPQNGSQPDPQLARNRRPSATPAPPARPANSYPRLLADSSGRVWLAYRTAHPTWWSGVGGVWFENVVSFDGGAWTNPIFITHSDNLLDNRPALVSTAAGELLIVGSADGRQQFHPRIAQYAAVNDPYNNDLYASRIVINDPVKAAQLEPAAIENPAAPYTVDIPNVKRLREYRMRVKTAEYRIVRGEFHRHTEISMDGMRDGSIWDSFRYMLDAAQMDWTGCCDHDNGHGREYTWWITQKYTDMFYLPGSFTPMFSYERSVQYPEGHRNVIFAQRGVRTLPRLPRVEENSTGSAPDTQMLYKYLRQFNGIVASHTSGTIMGTDWRDNDPLVEPIVEIYQGDRQNYEMPDAPRSNSAKDSIGGWREKGFVSLALEKGYKLGFQASSDHISTHMSYCNLLVTKPTRAGLLEAFQKRHIYGATDDILADVRCGDHLMGDQFDSAAPPVIKVKLIGTAPFAKVHIIRDNKYVYTVEPKTQTVDFTWRDEKPEAGKQSYYYVRGEQEDGEIVWVSPMWITYRGPAKK